MTGNATPQPNGHPTRPEHGAARHPEHDTPMYVRRRGLYLPTGTADATDLRGHLSAERDVVAVNHEHAWVSLAQDAQHHIRRADLKEHADRAKRSRRQRAKDATEAAKLADLYRSAKSAGARARVRAEMYASAEMRALRIAKIRKITLAAGIPVLLAFAAWSTTGVQAGVVKLLHLNEGDPSWWSAWGVEPALIAIVALIIIGRAVLRSSGGDTDGRATLAEWAALGTSLALNIFGGWTGGLEALAGAVAHSLGPLGCAGTAFLIGLFDTYIARATPYDGARRLADLGFDAEPDARAGVAVEGPQLPSLARFDYVALAAQIPGATSAVGPGVMPGVMPGAMPDLSPGAHPDVDPGIEADTHPDIDPGAHPVTDPGPGPDINPGSGPGPDPGAEPGAHTHETRAPKPHHTRIQTRVHPPSNKQVKALKLRAENPGMATAEIARRVGANEKTVRVWFKAAQDATEDPKESAGVAFHPLPIPDPKPATAAAANGRPFAPTEESR